MRPALLAPLAAIVLTAVPVRAQEGTKAPEPPVSAPPAGSIGRPVVGGPESSQKTFTADLEFQLGEGAKRCPGEMYLHQELSRRIGYDPFAPDAKGRFIGRFRVVIARAPQGLTATIDYEDASGSPKWHQTYSVNGTSKDACEIAISGVAIKLRPEFRISRVEAAPPPASAPLPAPAPPEAPPPPVTVTVLAPAPDAPAVAPTAPPPARSTRLRGEIGIGGLAGFGTAPGPSFGGVIHGGVQLFPFEPTSPWWLSLAAEGRVDVPVRGEIGKMYSVKATTFAASLVACGHGDLLRGSTVIPFLFGCVVGTVGAVRSEVPWPSTGESLVTSPYGGVGLRTGFGLQVASWVELRLHSTALIATRTPGVSERHGPRIWSASRLSGDASLNVIFLLGQSRP